MTTPAGRLAAVIAAHTWADPDELPTTASDRYALIEESHQTGRAWLTLHASRTAAAQYHDTQEYPEDWSIRELIDLRTGARYYAQPHTRWERYPEDVTP